MLADIVRIVLGLAVVVLGGEILVRNASRLAQRFGVSPLVVGLTVVAYGTSAPETAVSILSAVQGTAGVSVGNVVGSNIFNILIVLGVSALIMPLSVHQRVIRVDAPLGIAVTLLLGALILDGNIQKIEGVILFAGVLLYTFWAVRQSRVESAAVRREYAQQFEVSAKPRMSLALSVVFIVAGLALLAFGSSLLVGGASSLASRLGVSDTLVGLTIVAAGTSIPELATSVVAAVRGERDIAVGNVIGSNLFNILCVLGLSSLAAPGSLSVPPEVLRFDFWVMLAASVLVLPVFFSGLCISRLEGAAFVIGYVLYIWFLAVSASGGPGVERFRAVAAPLVIGMALLVVLAALKQVRSFRRG